MKSRKHTAEAARARTRAWGVVLAASLCLGAQDPAEQAPPPVVAEPVTVTPTPAPPATPPATPVYRDLEGVRALVQSWVDAPDDHAELVALPPSRGGRAIPAVQWGAPGPVPLAERMTICLFGALDGVSLSGCEAVLDVTASLLARVQELPPDVAFISVPWASPDAIASTLDGTGVDGRNALPTDDDGDRAIDEDGPDDLDGDGLVLDLLIADPSGPWTRSVDERFLARANEGDTPRYLWMREGKDDDHDGAFNEDGRGGTNLDVNFPIGWGDRDGDEGDLPLDDPTARALADLVLSRRAACVLLFQGNHGAVAIPGGRAGVKLVTPADASVFERVTRLFVQATGRSQTSMVTLAEARGYERAGAALDWLYSVQGALALEVAAWGPAIEAAPEAKGVALTDALFAGPPGQTGALGRAPAVGAQDLLWSRWLDNMRGGIGFVDWHPVELGDGREGLVGGWQPLSRVNPPVSCLPLALNGLSSFVARLATSLPRLEIRLPQVKRAGELCTIEAGLDNTGALPTGLSTTLPRAAANSARTTKPAGAILELLLPEGARLIAGSQVVSLAPIAPGASSERVTWLVLAAPGSVLTVRGTAPWTVPLSREVKP
jgi:hypothetical protein